MARSDGPLVPFFYGLQVRYFSRDRLYRVYVSDKLLAGAYVAGQFYDVESAELQLHQLGPLAWPFIRHVVKRRQGREALYDSMDPFAPSLMHFDKRNFHLPRSEVVRTHFRRNLNSFQWPPLNVGSVEFELLDGTVFRFMLVGGQRQEDVLRLVQQFDPGLEVTGEAPKVPSARTIRRNLVFFDVLCLGGAAYLLTEGLGADPGYLLLALLAGLVGLASWIKAWNLSGNQPGDDSESG